MNRSPATGIRPASSTSRPPIDAERPGGSAGLEPRLDRLARGAAVGLEHAGPGAGGCRRLVVVARSRRRSTRAGPRASRCPAVPPILVEHHRQVPPLPLHVDEQVAAGPARRRHRHRPDRERAPCSQLEEVEGVQHPHDLVERAAIHREPAVAALGEGLPDLGLASRPPGSPRCRCAASSPRAPGARRRSSRRRPAPARPSASGPTAAPPRRMARNSRLGAGAVGRQQQRRAAPTRGAAPAAWHAVPAPRGASRRAAGSR